jgi:hypothetical protein
VNVPECEARASNVATLILDRSKAILPEIADRDADQQETTTTFFYCVALYYILADRLAYDCLSDQDRAQLFDLVLWEIYRDIAAGTGASADAIAQILNGVIDELAPFSQKLFPEIDETPKGTLFWEYSKSVAGSDLGGVNLLTINSIAMQTCNQFIKDFLEMITGSAQGQ